MRQTSIEAFNSLRNVLPKRRWAVYEYLYKCGPRTQTDLKIALNDVTSSYSPRMAELKRMGLIQEVGTKEQESTGKKGILWDVTNRVNPLPLQKNKTKSESRIDELEEVLKLVKESRDAFGKVSDYVVSRIDEVICG